MLTCNYVFLFFKQKTAYEMRISDWSSDVCSSDLDAGRADEHFTRIAAEMARDLRRDLLDRFAPAIAGEGVAVARVDDQRATLEIGRASCRERVCQYV